MVEFPGGRLQSLSVAWDRRPKEQGGQRRFLFYSNERIDHADELHWTKPSQYWNTMCAECHSTQLQKNYDPVNRAYRTTWSEIDVACEVCHGPGSQHIAWAKTNKMGPTSAGPGRLKPALPDHETKGLTVQIDERNGVHWIVEPQSGRAHRSTLRLRKWAAG